MKRTLKLSLLCLLSCISGCATAVSPARESFILSKPHGWIEISINDYSVPARPPREGEEQPVPLSCSISIKVNHEHFLTDELYPTGQTSPYSINSGFRIAVPAGELNVEVSYRGCKIIEGEVKGYEIEAPAVIQEGYVTPVSFDGVSLTVGTPETNKAITLESINERLENIESILKTEK
jgi:hypothetical protein